MALNFYYLFEFLVNSIFFCLSFYAGLRIASRYREYEQKEFIFLGITVIIMVEPFWPFPINSFLLFLGEEILPLKISNFIQLIGLPIGIFCWVCVITEMIFKKRQKIILILSGIYCTIYELIFIPSIIIYSSIEENELVFGIMTFYGISFFIITITTGIRFAWENIKAENPINKNKGKFMFYGFIFYAIATISVWIDLFELISSILFLFSGTFLYFGFILPSWIKKRFL